MQDFSNVQEKMIEYMADEIASGHKDYSKISASEIHADPREFRKACIDLRDRGIINCNETYGGDDIVPCHVFNIYFTDRALIKLGHEPWNI